MNAISVFGLGKLGAPLAATLAARGFRVWGVDPLPAVVEAVNEGRVHIEEPGYPELLASVKGQFTATCSPTVAIQRSETSIILVPTPSGADGRFINDYVLAACQEIAAALALKGKPHLVIVASTVMPGSCQGVIRAALPDACLLAYSPEFVALGDVIKGFTHPDFVLIGADDEDSHRAAGSVYKRLYPNHPPIAHMSLVSAEIAKIALNSYITTKMTFANELGRLCERIPGADVDAITKAIGMDSRIGGKYLTAGAAYGGPCFPRDNRAFAKAGEDAGIRLPLPLIVDELNRSIAERVVDLILAYYAGGTVAVLGMSYKHHTPVQEESMGVQLVKLLQGRVEFVAPVADVGDAYPEGDFIVLALPYPGFIPRRGQVVLDCWRCLDPEKVRAAGAEYLALGVCNE